MFLYSSVLSLFACIPAQVDDPSQEPAEEFNDVSDIPTPSSDLDDEEEEDGEESSGEDSDEVEDTGPMEETGPVSYDFDDSTSLLYVQVWKDEDAWASSYAHDHVIRATSWEGEVVFDPANPGDCLFSFSVPVSSLAVDEDGMRELVGYGDAINSSDRSEIRDHMLGSDQLNVNSYSEIWFEASGCSSDGGSSGQLTVVGDFNVRGRTKSTSVTMSYTVTDDQFYFSGTASFSHNDFGFTPFEAYWGAVRNGDELAFTFDMVGDAS